MYRRIEPTAWPTFQGRVIEPFLAEKYYYPFLPEKYFYSHGSNC